MTNKLFLCRLAVKFLTPYFILQISIVDDKPVMADLSVLPLWNNSVKNQSSSDFCLLGIDNSRDEAIKFTGSSHQICGVQLIALNGTVILMHIPQGAFVYAEMQTNNSDCLKRYVSITGDESCIFVSQYSHIRLYLQSVNRTVLISDLPANNSMPTCSVVKYAEEHASKVSQTTECQIEVYDDVISCHLTSANTCSFKFPPNCNSTLGKRVVEFQCNTGNVYSSYSALIVYSANVINLNLTNRSIIALQGNPFTNLPILQELILDQNRLYYLNPHVLRDLTTLKYLSLEWNRFTFLDVTLFKTLTALDKLSLIGNHLMTLPVGIFQNITNLTELLLDNNRLTTLHHKILIGLKELRVLAIHNNKLEGLPEYLFNDTIRLMNLNLGANKLTSLSKNLFNGLNNLVSLNLDLNSLLFLPEGLFDGLKSLEYLNIDKNQLSSLDKSLFNETNRLTELFFYQNRLKQLPYNLFWGLRNLTTLDLGSNNLVILHKELFHRLTNLEVLYLDGNQMTTLNENLFSETGKLISLNLQRNALQSLPNSLFRRLHVLEYLNFYVNQLLSPPFDLFWGLSTLEYLSIDYNEIQDLNSNILNSLTNLQVLFLNHNQLRTLNCDLFKNTTNLRVLDLSENILSNIPDISNLKHLIFLNLKENKLTDIIMGTFSSLPKYMEMIVSQHEICECFVSDDINCTAGDERSPFLTCDRLLSDRGLVAVMWLIGLNAIGGNIFVLSQRKAKADKNKVQAFLLSHLAMSDLLMGVYMLLIASADIYFGAYFPMRAEVWRSGITCKIAGTISILSSEASVFFVTLISIDRFISIRYPHSRGMLNQKSSAIIVSSVWITSLALGVVPSSLAGKNDKFYANSHVCIGLPLSKLQMYKTNHFGWTETCSKEGICYWKKPVTSEYLGEVNGMIFASVMFLGLNFICYLIILACYVEIVRTVFKSSQRAGLNTEMKEQIRLTAKVAFIVLTDFACWFPIIVIGILVQAGVLVLPPDVFAWCVTFVLPINSAINPYLYTIAAIISSRRKRARIAAAESQQENTNCTANRRGQVSQSQNTHATELGIITSTGQQSGNDKDETRRTGFLPNMPDVSDVVESNI